MSESNGSDEHKLQSHHFAYFVGCCKALVRHIGINDWEISYQFLESDLDTPRASTTIYDKNNRLAGIQLHDSWDRVPSEFNIWKVAFHEVMELLLSDLSILAQSREWDYYDYDREHHRLIRILENSWFGGMWNDRHDIFNFQPDAEGRESSRPELPELGDQVSLPDPKLQNNKRHKK